MRLARLLPLLCPLLLPLSAVVLAQAQLGYDDVDETRRALATAQQQGEVARRRGEALETEAARATEAADKTAREAAAVAARIQQGEAAIAANEARLKLIARQRTVLQASLAARQQPVVRLTGALQRLSRRPMVLSLLRPGSTLDTMHLRAVLATMLPEVERRTSALRAEIDRGEALEQQALATSRALRADEAELSRRRQALAALETRQRLGSRAASGVADRESERALALAEQARDLGSLVDSLGEAGALRDQLAALPGPIMRPERPQESQVIAATTPLPSAQPSGLPGYLLPVAGRLVAGFGDVLQDGARSRGVALAARDGAQAVAPFAGRVAFAGPYRGFGNIVIIEHPGGWTSLVTGLAQLDAKVGDELVGGAPLGIAGPGRPVLNLELRRNGEPVNPLEFVNSN
ncbi:MAG TPA: peptidoglycan DD-metalloendopeptidase family protein [Novosphingobium sp.]|nr:peptidoglycan DD-metalloendopeptidase family protein [Novosphingobium sp.]